MILELSDGTYLKESDIKLEISNMIFQVIEENIAHKWCRTVEVSENINDNTLNFDYSGEVRIMTVHDVIELDNSLRSEYLSGGYCYAALDEMLRRTYIDGWERGMRQCLSRSWISYRKLLEYKFNDWKYMSFGYCGTGGRYDFDEIDDMLYEIFSNFLAEMPHSLYHAKLLKTVGEQILIL